MKLLALDLSTSTGYAIFEDGKLIEHAMFKVPIVNFNIKDFPERQEEYPYNIIDTAREVADNVCNIISECNPDKIVIENTVKSKNRNTQRLLEAIHVILLMCIEEYKYNILYVDPSQWRKGLNMRLTMEDKAHNKLVKKKLKRGKLTAKHLSVRLVNERFNLEFKLKDNDITDAICIGLFYCENFM